MSKHIEGECPECHGELHYAHIDDALKNYMCSLLTSIDCDKEHGAIPCQCNMCGKDFESVFKLVFIKHREDKHLFQHYIKEALER